MRCVDFVLLERGVWRKCWIIRRCVMCNVLFGVGLLSLFLLQRVDVLLKCIVHISLLSCASFCGKLPKWKGGVDIQNAISCSGKRKLPAYAINPLFSTELRVLRMIRVLWMCF